MDNNENINNEDIIIDNPTIKEKTKSKKSIFKSTPFLLSACLTLSLIGGYSGATIANKNNKSNNSIVNQSQVVQTNNSNSATTTISDVANEALKTIVEIRTESVSTNQFMQQYTSSGAGSGVILSSDGYIVTNHHVIENAKNITVTDYQGQSYNAKLIGSDKKSDLAVLKIDATNLNAATFADSSNLKIGDTAIAIGNPLGELGGTVTTGIISALDREIQINGETMTLLQTNAAINPGNSGGGLFNANGEIIGIVNAKSAGENIEGLGFAIPANNAKTVIDELMNNGYVSNRPFLGVSLAEGHQNFNMTKSVYIASVTDHSAASEAGLQKGDQILKIDDHNITSANDVKSIIDKHKVGDTISISILRNNSQQNINVTLKEQQPTTYTN